MRPVALVVEDEPDLLQVLTLALGGALPAVEVRVADSVAAAEEVLAEVSLAGGSIVLVVADHNLAGDDVTGLVLIEQVRRQFPSAARFLFTGQASPDVEERARALGAKVLWKPLRLASLVAEVQGALAR